MKPWNVATANFEANRAAMRRRAELVPYTYTLARAAFDTGLAPLRPLYYEYPEIDQAYAADASGNFAQYFFGPDLVGKGYYWYTAAGALRLHSPGLSCRLAELKSCTERASLFGWQAIATTGDVMSIAGLQHQ